MSEQTPSDSNPTDDDRLQKRAVTCGSLPLETEEEDRFSMSSASPCPKQEPSLGRVTSASPSGEESRSCVLNLSQDSLSNMVLHTSPTLESIKELDEGEDVSSGRRSPGDGEVRVKGTDPNSDLPDFELGDRNCEAPEIPDSRDGEQHGAVFVTAQTSVNVLNLNKDALADVTGSNRDLSKDRCPSEWNYKKEMKSPELSSPNVCGFQPELDNRYPTEPNDHAETPDALDQDALRSSLLFERDLGAEPQDQRELLPAAAKDMSNREEEHLPSLLTRSGKNIDDNQTINQTEADSSKDSLIEVLNACKSKVEQLELLEQSSCELTAQLLSAQALAVGLQCRVKWLEQEHRLKGREVDELLGELQRTRETLEEKSLEMDRASAHIQLLQLRLGEPQRDAAAGVSGVHANGHTNTGASQLPGQSSPDSRVCRLL